jgi:hypothetical protein
MARHCVNRNFVRARSSDLQLFSEATLRLQSNSGINVSTREIQDNSQAVEFCGTGLADTAADDVAERRFPDTHVSVLMLPGQLILKAMKLLGLSYKDIVAAGRVSFLLPGASFVRL